MRPSRIEVIGAGIVCIFGPGLALAAMTSAWVPTPVLNIAFECLVGCTILWVLALFWRCDADSDSRLYWLLLCLMFVPIALPVFWYKKVYRKYKANQAADRTAPGVTPPPTQKVRH